ncbi:MAG: DUF4916 domain-containing protein [Actinomycetia bacterium]|nr:DUF4916 domain-containing protein [Actinomycetes bacterium]MCP4961738.1 DUF4916 domain-containing protein [Actinomycetes bacterium]
MGEIDNDIDVDIESQWLSDDDLETLRGKIPIVYVEAVPVRLDELGRVTHVGLLRRAMADGTISLAIVSGRVLWGESLREALMRNLDKDLGPAAFPRLPASPTPFTVAEYMPDPIQTGFHDPRQHAVSLAYVVPIQGHCEPARSALEFSWVETHEAGGLAVSAEMTGGQDRIVRRALAHVGRLP